MSISRKRLLAIAIVLIVFLVPTMVVQALTVEQPPKLIAWQVQYFFIDGEFIESKFISPPIARYNWPKVSGFDGCNTYESEFLGIQPTQWPGITKTTTTRMRTLLACFKTDPVTNERISTSSYEDQFALFIGTPKKTLLWGEKMIVWRVKFPNIDFIVFEKQR